MDSLETPPDRPYAFVYFITISNKSKDSLTVKGRKWVIESKNRDKLVVEGDGVVGQTPYLRPGEEFSYNSYHVVAMDSSAVGSFLALWVIGYGAVQSVAPMLTGKARLPDGNTLTLWAILLCAIPAAIAIALQLNWHSEMALLAGLLLFGTVFAVNSSLHSYMIICYAKSDAVSLDVGFYYMANAMGRLLGTVLSGWLYQAYGLIACLWVSSALLAATVLVSARLSKHQA